MNYTYADTKYGRLRGRITETRFGNIHEFRGVRYAAPPLGKLRFRPAVEQDGWEGTRDALEYGNRAIQGAMPFVMPDKDHLKYMQRNTDLRKGDKPPKGEAPAESEDCLFLNVWTPAVKDGKKRAVMVWCHGGGFTEGAGDNNWKNGSNLAASEDVVVVSFNHRLAVWGYLYLAEEQDPDFKNAANAGLTDMVMVLRWIHDSIAEFGGDPENVLVFGESGGGQKVCVLTAMPSAKGLFHKVISMSGGYFTLPKAPMLQAARDTIAELGLKSDDLHLLNELPAETIYAAYKKVVERYKIGADFGFCFDPVVDGNVLPCSPFSEDFGEINKDIIFMSGSMKDDGRLEGAMNGILFELNTPEEVRAELITLHVPEDKVDSVMADYKAMLPEGRNSWNDVLQAYITDLRFRQAAIAQAEIRVRHHCAPAYMYTFSWETPDPIYRATHAMEVPFAFKQLDIAPFLTSNPDDGHRYLEEMFSRAFATFAKTGNPNFEGLPHWDTYNTETRMTMDFAATCHQVSDPLKRGREIMEMIDYTK